MKKTPTYFHTIIIVITILLFNQCNSVKNAGDLFSSRSPYEGYVKRLHDAKLDSSLMSLKWLETGKYALYDSLKIDLPYQETGFFNAGEPKALGFTMKAVEGAHLKIEMEFVRSDSFHVFIDLFRKVNGKPEHLASAEEGKTTLIYSMNHQEDLVLRVQPELLAEGYYHLKVSSLPSLAFPVDKRDHRAIGSIFGDPRDGGRRLHKGIDIFAPRGTPALAATEGRITRVNQTRLGGKVVWLWDAKGSQNIYYAHLDSQMVRTGQKVHIGDTIGLIGNTGNAVSTPPHLHFAVYRYGKGAVDPYPFVHQPLLTSLAADIATEPLGHWMRSSATEVNFRTGPTTAAGIIQSLPPHTPVKVIAISESWIKVSLPQGTKGFIYKSLLKPLNDKKYLLVETDTFVYKRPLINAGPAALISANKQVSVLAVYEGFYLVSADGQEGWMKI